MDSAPSEALERFLDVTLPLEERQRALNEPSVSDDAQHRFIRALTPHHRQTALALSYRPRVLHLWATSGSVKERAIVAFNPRTTSETLERLWNDVPRVRTQLPFNPNTNLKLWTRLLMDRSPEMRGALRTAFALWAKWTLQGRGRLERNATR